MISDRDTSTEQVTQDGCWSWDTRTGTLVWSDDLYRIFGVEPGAITPSPAYVLRSAHPDDVGRVQEALAAGRAEGLIGRLEYRIVRPDGLVRNLRALQTTIGQEASAPGTLYGVIQDVTDWRRAERQLEARVAVSEALEHWETVEVGAAALLRRLVETLDCVAAVLWAPRNDRLVALHGWCPQDSRADGMGLPTRPLRPGSGLPGRAWAAQRAVAAPLAAEVGERPRSIVAVPALHADEVLAVIEFYGDRGRYEIDDSVLRSMMGMGYELGEFLSHRRWELSPGALTPREHEILQIAAAEGLRTREIADRLVLSPATVTTHFNNIYEKFEVSDRASAVAHAFRAGLIA